MMNNKLSRRSILKGGTIAGLSALGIGSSLLTGKPALAAVQRETWDVVGNGYAGTLVFIGIGNYTANALPGTTYIGTAYDNPMLSYFTPKSNGLYDMAFIRAHEADFSYFQLWFGVWDENNQTMYGQFYGVTRNGLQFLVDGPYSWNATLRYGGSYDTYTNTNPGAYLRLSESKRGTGSPVYADAALYGYAGSSTHQFLQGFIQYQGAPTCPLVGHHIGDFYSFIEGFEPGFRSMQYFTGYASDNGYLLDGKRLTLYFDRNTATITKPVNSLLDWHTIKK